MQSTHALEEDTQGSYDVLRDRHMRCNALAGCALDPAPSVGGGARSSGLSEATELSGGGAKSSGFSEAEALSERVSLLELGFSAEAAEAELLLAPAFRVPGKKFSCLKGLPSQPRSYARGKSFSRT